MENYIIQQWWGNPALGEVPPDGSSLMLMGLINTYATVKWLKRLDCRWAVPWKRVWVKMVTMLTLSKWSQFLSFDLKSFFWWSFYGVFNVNITTTWRDPHSENAPPAGDGLKRSYNDRSCRTYGHGCCYNLISSVRIRRKRWERQSWSKPWFPPCTEKVIQGQRRIWFISNTETWNNQLIKNKSDFSVLKNEIVQILQILLW